MRRDLLDLLGLGDKAKAAPGVLSGGQRQRLAIARALANEPTLLLADEPTGALDSDGGQEVMELFRRLHAGGQTILMVTHDDDVAAAAERIVRMRDGKVVDTGDSALAGARRQRRHRPLITATDVPLASLTMGIVGLLVRAELRRRWRTLLVLGLLVGVVAGASMWGVAAARRTGSSYARLLDATEHRAPAGQPDRRLRRPRRPRRPTPGDRQLRRGSPHRSRRSGPTAAPIELEALTLTLATAAASTTCRASRWIDGRLPDPDEPYEIFLEQRPRPPTSGSARRHDPCLLHALRRRRGRDPPRGRAGRHGRRCPRRGRLPRRQRRAGVPDPHADAGVPRGP